MLGIGLDRIRAAVSENVLRGERFGARVDVPEGATDLERFVADVRRRVERRGGVEGLRVEVEGRVVRFAWLAGEAARALAVEVYPESDFYAWAVVPPSRRRVPVPEQRSLVTPSDVADRICGVKRRDARSR